LPARKIRLSPLTGYRKWIIIYHSIYTLYLSEQASRGALEENMESTWQSGLAYYDSLTDEQIIHRVRGGDMDAQDFLLNKYKNLVRAKARSYFLVGADREDIIQEGMIGLYKAIRDFDPERLSSFHAFADLCVTRQMITAVKTATRQKHIPLNSYISLNKPVYKEDEQRTLQDIVSYSWEQDPEELLISMESRRNIQARIEDSLSALEREVLNNYLQDKSYQQIAEEMQRHVKCIDNALQRVKKKLERYLEEQAKE
jgi:RNA polymerase sporulation-specific sigma factor